MGEKCFSWEDMYILRETMYVLTSKIYYSYLAAGGRHLENEMYISSGECIF